MTLTFFFFFVLLPLIAFFCFITNIQGDYSSTCSPTNMLRCESGDLSGKHDPLEVGGGRVFFNDVNLPLFGSNSGNNHGVFTIVVCSLWLVTALHIPLVAPHCQMDPSEV